MTVKLANYFLAIAPGDEEIYLYSPYYVTKTAQPARALGGE